LTNRGNMKEDDDSGILINVDSAYVIPLSQSSNYEDTLVAQILHHHSRRLFSRSKQSFGASKDVISSRLGKSWRTTARQLNNHNNNNNKNNNKSKNNASTEEKNGSNEKKGHSSTKQSEKTEAPTESNNKNTKKSGKTEAPTESENKKSEEIDSMSESSENHDEKSDKNSSKGDSSNNEDGGDKSEADTSNIGEGKSANDNQDTTFESIDQEDDILDDEEIDIVKDGKIVEVTRISNCFSALYFGYISLGEPAQLFNVALDTTSPDLWVPSVKCDGCDTDGLWAKYDEEASVSWSPYSTKKKTNVFTTLANDGTVLIGETARDVLHIGEWRVDDQVFGQITIFPETFSTCANVVGSLGLGFRDNSDTNQPYTTVQEMISEIMGNSVFSLYLRGSLEEKSSLLILGGVSQKHYMGCLTWYEVQDPKLFNWNFEVDHIKSGYQSLHNKVNTAVLDSSSHLIIGEAKSINHFVNMNNATCFTITDFKDGSDVFMYNDFKIEEELPCSGVDYDVATVPCDNVDFAPLIFKVKKTEYILDMVDLVTYGFNYEGEHLCLLRVVPDNEIDHWVFGTPWFNKYYTAFDVKGMRVGFAEMAFDMKGEEVDVCQADMSLDVDVESVLEEVEDIEMEVIHTIIDLHDEEAEVMEKQDEAIEHIMENVYHTEEEVGDVVVEVINQEEPQKGFNHENEEEEFIEGIEEQMKDTYEYPVDDVVNNDDLTFESSIVNATVGDQLSLINGIKERSKAVEVGFVGILVVGTLFILNTVRRNRYYGRSSPVETEMYQRYSFEQYLWGTTSDDGHMID